MDNGTRETSNLGAVNRQQIEEEDFLFILNTVIKSHFLASIIFTTKGTKYHKEEKKFFFLFLVTFVPQGYDMVK